MLDVSRFQFPFLLVLMTFLAVMIVLIVNYRRNRKRLKEREDRS